MNRIKKRRLQCWNDGHSFARLKIRGQQMQTLGGSTVAFVSVPKTWQIALHFCFPPGGGTRFKNSEVE